MKRELFMVMLCATVAQAEPKLKKGFWKILVQPKQKWVLTSSTGKAKITVETYDVRKVDGIDVARIRYTSGDRNLGDSATGMVDQVGVGKDGLWIMSADMDDKKVSAWLKKKVSRSDPPKAYKSTKQNNRRFLSIQDETTICMGTGPMEGDPPCEETACGGEVCFSSEKGVVEISGDIAPDFEIYKQ